MVSARTCLNSRKSSTRKKAVIDEQVEAAKLWTGKERVRSLLEFMDRRKDGKEKVRKKKKDRRKK